MLEWLAWHPGLHTVEKEVSSAWWLLAQAEDSAVSRCDLSSLQGRTVQDYSVTFHHPCSLLCRAQSVVHGFRPLLIL
jgi:hypothetical protein